MTTPKLTPGVLKLFTDLAEDAGNWSGTPLLGGNVPTNSRTNGYLIHLKKAGLVTTFTERVEGLRRGRERTLTWVEFTEAGAAYAKELGISMVDWDRHNAKGDSA